MHTNPEKQFLSTSGGRDGGFKGQIDNVHLVNRLLPPADADADGLLDTWEAAHGLSIGSGTGDDGPDGDPDGDGDGDGASNLHEFAFGGDPQSATDRSPSLTRMEAISGAGYLILTVLCRSSAIFVGSGPLTASADGVNYTLRGSNDLNGFNAGVMELFPAITSNLPAAQAGYNYHTFRLTDSQASHPRGFLQAIASITPHSP